ncbi:uncharacterized protein DFL_008326 [Arthrobotrys flagrans]|uniref:Kelch repeat-containing protein n=1 Tax=Arthrobotrys flagrans TaxID=97331 RepID=A0A436ZNF3_ARTFL|nr:hypothetical protein DFL_008326 [Arthrobotrys flagrans]
MAIKVTAVIDNRLYVDGGILQIDRSNPMAPWDNANYSNPDFFYFDLSTTYRGPVYVGQPSFITNILRKKPSEVPSLEGGTLWADTVNKRLFLYGGQFTTSPPSPFNMWSYDAIYDTWAAINQSRDSSGIPVGVARLYNGASAVVEASGMAYYFGGWISSDSEYAYEGKEVAVADGIDIGRRAEGVMLYVPLGDSGILVAFGGIRMDEDGRKSAVPMSEITIYNIASRQWFVQKATGDIPESRRLFCAGVASGTAPGKNLNETQRRPLHNIYLYGGASTSPGPGFDDVYILTLPNFVWTKFWPVDDIPRHPHQRLTCNVIQNTQMLILGGYFPLGGECDTPDQSAIHNLNLSGSNPEGTIWGDFEVRLRNYQYRVPTAVVDNLNSAEAVTFNHPDLVTIVSRTAPESSRTPTRDVSGPTNGLSKRDRTIVLATTIPGGILLVALIFLCIRWYKHRANTTDVPSPAPPMYDTHHTNINQLPTSPIVQPSALSLAQPPSSGHSTPASPPLPIVPIQQIPVAYVVNPTGGLTPVYSSAGPTAVGGVSPPMELHPQFVTSEVSGTSQSYSQGNAQSYNNNSTGKPPIELPADPSKPSRS